MLILRNQTLILRTRDIIEGALRILHDDAAETDGACLTVIFSSQINPDNSTKDETKHD